MKRHEHPTNAQTREMFDAVADDYDPNVWFDRTRRSPYAYRSVQKRLIGALALGGGERVLEVGCGPGTWTRVMVAEGAVVHAVDISPMMIDRARHFVTADSATFEVSDFGEFQSEEQFDRVVSARAIEYMREGSDAVAKLATFVAPGGRLVIMTKTPFSLWRGRRLVESLLKKVARPRSANAGPPFAEFYHVRLSFGLLKRTLSDAGFVDITVHPAVTGLPILRGVDGDIPIVPARWTDRSLAAANRLADAIDRAPQWLVRALLPVTESYIVVSRRR